MVGAPASSPAGTEPGRAYVFDRQFARAACAPSTTRRLEPGRGFGASVAIVDGRVLVGAPLASNRQPQGRRRLPVRPAKLHALQTFLSPERRLGTTASARRSRPGPSGPVIGAPGRGRVFVYMQSQPQGVAAVLSMLRDTLVPSAIAAGPQCGNGVPEGGEACDDGNDVDTDDCRNDCSGGFCCVIDPPSSPSAATTSIPAPTTRSTQRPTVA